MYSAKITSSTQEALTGIKYCPGTEVELPKYFHMEYKGSGSRSWPVQYHHCAGRAGEELSIPRRYEGSHKGVMVYRLEEVSSMWKSKEKELGEQKLLQTERMMGERRFSQDFVDLCQQSNL